MEEMNESKYLMPDAAEKETIVNEEGEVNVVKMQKTETQILEDINTKLDLLLTANRMNVE